MLYHGGDSQHTQSIQVNKVIGENEKMCLLFYGKKKHTEFLTNPTYKYKSLASPDISGVLDILCPQSNKDRWSAAEQLCSL